MSYYLTTSFHKGTCANAHIGHNKRTIAVPHADKDRQHLNKTYVDMSLEDAYEKLFGDALKEYNKGKKPSRQIKNYLEHIRAQYEKGEQKVRDAMARGASKKEIGKIRQTYPKPFYEVIVSIGNCKDYDGAFACGGAKEETAVAILDEYMRDFQSRNPNLFVFSANLHRDESGVPHIHIDYIPWTDLEQSRGLKVRVSENGAFKQQGILDLGGDGIGTVKFQESERIALDGYAREYDIEIVAGKHGKKHLDTREYQIDQDEQAVEVSKDKLEQRATEIVDLKNRMVDILVRNPDTHILALQKKSETLQKTVKECEPVRNRANDILSQHWQDFNNSSAAFYDEYNQKKKQLQWELQQARQTAYSRRKYLSNALNSLYHSNELFIVKLFRLVDILFVALENTLAQKEVKRLQESNNQLKNLAKKVMSESQTVGDALRAGDIEEIETALSTFHNRLETSITAIKTAKFPKKEEQEQEQTTTKSLLQWYKDRGGGER